MRRAGIAAIAFVIAITPALAASAQSEITLEDIAAAELRRRAIGVELTEATGQYDASVARLIELENSLTALGIELSKSEQELAGARVAAKEIAGDRYMFAGAGSSALFDSVTIHDARIRTGYLEILSRVGTDTVIKLFALEEGYEAQQAIVEQALASQVATKAELEELAEAMVQEWV